MKELLTVNLHGNLQIVVQVHLVTPMSCSHISWCEVGVFQELPADVVFLSGHLAHLTLNEGIIRALFSLLFSFKPFSVQAEPHHFSSVRRIFFFLC
jgi:hypothetical protein